MRQRPGMSTWWDWSGHLSTLVTYSDGWPTDKLTVCLFVFSATATAIASYYWVALKNKKMAVENLVGWLDGWVGFFFFFGNVTS